MPEKFGVWRNLQSQAVAAAIDSRKRFVLQAAPTGFGKSLAYVAQALITGDRTIILTSTKGLQTQLMEDFAPAGLVDIRGMNGYPCVAAEDFGVPMHGGRVIKCDEGPCRSGMKCPLREGGCEYYDAYRVAGGAELVVTNYAYWMTINKYGEGLGNFDLLVLDEGHAAPDELSNFLSIELEGMEIEQVLASRPPGPTIDDWRTWAVHHASRLQEKTEKAQRTMAEVRAEDGAGRISYAQMREASAMRRVLGKLKSLAGMKGEWVYEAHGRRHHFDPVWPAAYSEQALFRGIKKVVIFSATLRPKTAEILGIPKDKYEFKEYPSPFPVARRPVYHVPTVQMNHRATDIHLRAWMLKIDQIIRDRHDRKGIIHAVSFERCRYILQHSEYASIMVANTSANTRAVVDRFKDASAPCVLVSPSVSTGWDFPFDLCRYQIVGKIPFPDNRALVMQARLKSDKDYTNYIAAQTLVQMAGRGMRAEEDLCETLVVDDNIVWFIWKYKHFFPDWFLASYKSVVTIPKPLALGD